jgi:hypothetical protein
MRLSRVSLNNNMFLTCQSAGIFKGTHIAGLPLNMSKKRNIASQKLQIMLLNMRFPTSPTKSLGKIT